MTSATPDEGDVLALVTTLRVATPPEWSADELEVWRESELLPLTERRELMFDLRIGRQSRAILASDWLAAHDARVAAKALREYAERVAAGALVIRSPDSRLLLSVLAGEMSRHADAIERGAL